MIKKFTQAKKILSLFLFLCTLNTVQAQCLIGDIDATPTLSDFNGGYFEVGDYLYFTSTTQAMGNELFMLNFNTDEVTSVDINPGPDSSEIRDIHIFGDYLYFTADDGKRGRELWKVDVGTLDTAMVDISSGAASSFLESPSFFAPPTPFVELEGKIYFPATNNGDTELYMITQGMLDVTSININPDTSSFPKRLLVVDNQLYFIAETGRVEDEADKTGETNELIVIEGGTLDTTIIPGTGGIDDNLITIAGDYLYFTIVRTTTTFGGEGDLHFLQKGSTGPPTQLMTTLSLNANTPIFDKAFFDDNLYFTDVNNRQLYYTTPGSATIDTVVTPLFGEVNFVATFDSISNLYYSGFNNTTGARSEHFVLEEGATTGIKTGINTNLYRSLAFLRERNNKLFMQLLSFDSIAIATMDLTTYEVEILDIRPGNFIFDDLPFPGFIFSDNLIITHRYNQLVTVNMETSEIRNDTLNYPDSLHLAGLTLRGNDYYYFHGEVGKPGGGIYKFSFFEAGTGSEKTVNLGEEINLATLVAGEDTGGEWMRKDGIGGTFNEIAGTINITADFMTSTFLYVNNACQSADTAIVKLNFTLPPCPTVSAGSDTTICNNNYTLQGTALQTDETGEWTFVNNPNDAGTLTNPTSSTAMVNVNFSTEDIFENNSSSSHTVTLRWTVTSGSCAMGVSDEVTITLNPPVNAGVDRLNICGTTINLGAVPASDGTGSWTFISNPNNSGSIDDVSKANATLTGVIGGNYELEWMVTGGACNGSMDRVKLAFQPDSDNDTFQDCVDLCEGGDDRINTDGMGIPDDCDCDINDTANEFVVLDAASYTTFINEQTGQDTARRIVDFQLTSTAMIESTHPVVVFQAGNNIILQAGFHAKAGSNFIAEIDYCKDPAANNFSTEQSASSRTQQTNVERINDRLSMAVFPNPIKQEAAINLVLPTDMLIDLMLFNQNGQLVKHYLNSQAEPKGAHYYKLDANNLSSGLYFLQLRSTEGVITQKLVVKK